MDLILLPFRITFWIFEIWIVAIFGVFELLFEGILFVFQILWSGLVKLFETGQRHAEGFRRWRRCR